MDVVVTVPQRLWQSWKDEGDLPGEPWSRYESHWMFAGPPPNIQPKDRVYIVAFGLLRGYAPLEYVEEQCVLDRRRRCLVRWGGAVAATIDQPIRGFQGWRYVWWDRADERAYPEWATDNVPAEIAARITAQIGGTR